MNDIAQAIEEARAEIAVAASEFMPDVCDISGPSLVSGGASGDSVTTGPVASNIPIRVKSAGGGRQITIGGNTYTITNRLRLPRTSVTAALTPQHKLTVRARGNTSARVFENLIPDEDSMDAMLWVSATAVIQGYQQ